MARTTTRSKHRRVPPPGRRARVTAATLAGVSTALLLTALAAMNSFGMLAAGQGDAPTLTPGPGDPGSAAALTPDHLGTLPAPPGLRAGGTTAATTTGRTPTTPTAAGPGPSIARGPVKAGPADVAHGASSTVCPMTPQSTPASTSAGSTVPTTTTPGTTTSAPETTPTGPCGVYRSGHGENTAPADSAPATVTPTPGSGF
jgi:hypothetical protein